MGSSVSPTSEPLRRLGRYEVLSEIASGGMASVYLGRVQGAGGFERLVAIKRCHPHLRHDQQFAELFLQEARLAAKLNHPNVVATLDVGSPEELYLVMEYVEGDRLSSLAREAQDHGQRIPIPILMRILLDTLAGLQHAHELLDSDGSPMGLVHRDVSPQNILVGVNGISRLTDFGIAKATYRSEVTQGGFLKGKLAYMAPEQLMNERLDARTDLFAVGVIAWQLLTNLSLFQGTNNAITVANILKKSVPAPSTLALDVPSCLDEILLRVLDRDRNNRYSNAAEFAEALEATKLPVASHREVGALVRKLCASELQRRERTRLLPTPTTQAEIPSPLEVTRRRAKSSIPRPEPVTSSELTKTSNSQHTRFLLASAATLLVAVLASVFYPRQGQQRGVRPSVPPRQAPPPPTPVPELASSSPVVPPPPALPQVLEAASPTVVSVVHPPLSLRSTRKTPSRIQGRRRTTSVPRWQPRTIHVLR